MMLGLQSHAVAEPMAALQAIGAVRYAGDVLRIVSDAGSAKPPANVMPHPSTSGGVWRWRVRGRARRA